MSMQAPETERCVQCGKDVNDLAFHLFADHNPVGQLGWSCQEILPGGGRCIGLVTSWVGQILHYKRDHYYRKRYQTSIDQNANFTRWWRIASSI